MKKLSVSGAVALMLLVGTGCSRGYLSPEDMESGQIGPRYCAQTCDELGLEMGAFVLVQHSYAGCVCEPRRTSGGSEVVGGAAVEAGATVAIIERQQQQSRTTPTQTMSH